MPADGLAPPGARPSAGTVMTTLMTCIYTGPALPRLTNNTASLDIVIVTQIAIVTQNTINNQQVRTHPAHFLPWIIKQHNWPYKMQPLPNLSSKRNYLLTEIYNLINREDNDDGTGSRTDALKSFIVVTNKYAILSDLTGWFHHIFCNFLRLIIYNMIHKILLGYTIFFCFIWN